MDGAEYFWGSQSSTAFRWCATAEVVENEPKTGDFGISEESIRIDLGEREGKKGGMAAFVDALTVGTQGKGTYEITEACGEVVRKSGIRMGMATVFVQHTSCSLVIFENADRSARTDLHAFFDRLVPEEADYFVHTHEGADDMPSHLRMALTRTSEVIPVVEGRLALGTWQGIFLFEHRRAPHVRSVVVSVVG
jgi:secondary thiamine-phosphate synthase enzyme